MSTPALKLADFDPSVRPQDDLFLHVNGTWLATTSIPAHLPSYGSFLELREAAEAAVKEIIRIVEGGHTTQKQIKSF